MYYILDENLNPIKTDDVLEWGRFFKDINLRQVANDIVGNIHVSTVFLGIDHNFSDEGEPLVFETMVFMPDDDDEYCERYSTWAEAEAGHKRILARYTR